MITRTTLIALGLMLAACDQSAPPAAQADAASPGNELPVAAELLASDVLAGTWEEVGDEGTTGVRFTSPDYPDTLTIGCTEGAGEAFINWTVRDTAQDGEVRIYTAAETVTFAATGSNHDGHLLNVAVPDRDLRLAVLRVQQERFAVQGFGQAIVVPWTASVGAALSACAG